ncbi:hypothetical protein EWM64_g786 [Hericium alpestre]|uniref:NmrA-like domain-containing protein n=1 Tax=Hericium alpestre TaxID=135208 RepID=A0A4Z0A9K4_9AGAM|nr:hypothetical protein EWM64_g786 [Hericium alpestre]
MPGIGGNLSVLQSLHYVAETHPRHWRYRHPGIAVIDSLLAPAADRSPSPYSVRALTRDPSSGRATELAAKGVEVVQGDTDHLATVSSALKGVWGAWVNVDTFSVGEVKEVFAGLRIFELAHQAGVRHYVWSSLDYISKISGYNDLYRSEHHDAKGRVAEFMRLSPSVVSDTTLSWTVVTTGPCMDMINSASLIDPLRAAGQLADGTFVFASPLTKGHMPLIALKDVGFWARWTFDNREASSRKRLDVASQMVTWSDIVAAFTKVTGKTAIFQPVSLDEWLSLIQNPDRPVAHGRINSMSYRQNFSAWWTTYDHDLITRDTDWIRSVHPGNRSVEDSMRETSYDGSINMNLLKDIEDNKMPRLVGSS